jgi:hypothetical protein
MYRKRSHGHRYYTSLILHQSSLNDFYQLYISRWVCMTFAGNNFHRLFQNYIPCTTHVWKTTLQIRIQMNIILQQWSWILSQTDEVDQSSFLRISFANKVIDAFKIGNIFHHKSVKYRSPAYFKDQSVPIISYSYVTPIATKISN